jgi:glycosyltransferase involved in cell wall biosynthesis
MKIVALPRNPNPYQCLLYAEVRRAGHSVRYAGRLTPSHTLNLLLLPLELAACRASGWRVLHLHWVFVFKLPGSDRFPFLRRIAQGWFAFVLAVSHILGIRLVWTAHNVLPHERVFHDEIAARRRLVRSSELVLAHSRAALDGLEQIGIRPSRSVVVRQGSPSPTVDASALRPPGGGESLVRKLLFFGQVLEYKGIEDLLEVMIRVPGTVPVDLLVAGQCRDSALRQRLVGLAERCGARAQLRLERVPEDELAAMMAGADAVVLPFRRVTNSGSVLLAMGYGRAVLLPDLPAFADLPREAAVFYDGSIDGLERAVVDIAHCSAERLQALGAAASAYVSTLSWADAAGQTLAAIGA